MMCSGTQFPQGQDLRLFGSPTDNVIASAAATVAKVAAEAKLPVVASDSALVRAGSLASISVDYYELGRMTGAMGADILEARKRREKFQSVSRLHKSPSLI